jgi:beta-lactamase superfamily II metal-dependent hydrolase
MNDVLAGPPPEKDTFELSLFGTGLGEAVAMHLGDGAWVLVDSCRPGRNDQPLSLEYLNKLGVPADAVRRIIITHWHDDHVDGVAQLVKAFPDAQVMLSSAFAVDEFSELLGFYTLDGRIVDRRTSGVRELGAVLNQLAARVGTGKAKDSAKNVRPIKADELLFKAGDCELHALAPSHGAMAIAREEIATLYKQLIGEDEQPLTIPRAERNHYSVVLWLRWGELRVLLGGDLEVHSDPGLGWNAVLNCGLFPDGSASIVKVAHHGSPTGDHPTAWDKLIIKTEPVAVVTAFNKGVTKLPSEGDLARLRARTSELYATTLPSKAPPRRDPTVEKELKAVVKSRNVLRKNAGHIRVRWAPGKPVEVSVAGAAAKVP